MIFPARFLVLDVYRSWMVGRSAPIIISADLTVRCNLFLSSLVAKPNQTVMNEQESADKHPYNHMGIRLSPIQPHGHTPTPADRHPDNHMGIRQTDTHITTWAYARQTPIQPHGHTPDKHPYNHMGIRQTN